MDLPWTSIVQTSGSPNVAAIDRLRIAVTDDSSGTVTVNVGGWALVSPSSTFPSGVVSLTFDDGYDDQFDKARPAMDAYGYRGTAYVVQDLIGQSGYMTLDQLKALKRLNGWEIGGHAKESDTHTNRFTSLTSSELDLELREHRQWLIENGLDADSLAYPGGVYTPTVAEIVGRLFPVARTTFSQLLEVQAPTDRLRLRAYNIVDTTPVATITDLIDDAVANDEWLILIFHRIEDTASSTISYDTADFESVLSHLDSNSVEVAPVREVMARLAD